MFSALRAVAVRLSIALLLLAIAAPLALAQQAPKTEALIEALADADATKAAAAQKAILARGAKALPALHKALLSDKPVPLRSKVAILLAAIKSPESIPALVTATADKSEEIGAAAVMALRLITDKQLVPGELKGDNLKKVSAAWKAWNAKREAAIAAAKAKAEADAKAKAREAQLAAKVAELASKDQAVAAKAQAFWTKLGAEQATAELVARYAKAGAARGPVLALLGRLGQAAGKAHIGKVLSSESDPALVRAAGAALGAKTAGASAAARYLGDRSKLADELRAALLDLALADAASAKQVLAVAVASEGGKAWDRLWKLALAAPAKERLAYARAALRHPTAKARGAAVKALIAQDDVQGLSVASGDKSKRVRKSAIAGLGRSKDVARAGDALERLVSAGADGDTRGAAARALAKLNRARAQRVATQRLGREADAGVRLALTRLLGNDPALAGPLAARLQDKDAEVRAQALAQLASIASGKAASNGRAQARRALLLRAFGAPGAEASAALAWVAKARPAGGLEKARAALAAEGADRASLIKVISAYGQREDAGLLVEALGDGDAGVRAAALAGLRRFESKLPFDPKGADAARAKQLAGWKAWLAAANSKLASERELLAKLKGFVSASASKREAVIADFAKAGAAGTAALAKGLDQPRTAVRQAAAEIALALPTVALIDALSARAADDNEKVAVRSAAVRAVGAIAGLEGELSKAQRAAATAALGKAYTGGTTPLRERALSALTALTGDAADGKPSAAAVKTFTAALGDKESGLRRQAASALARPGAEAATEALAAALEKDEEDGVRAEAARALGAIGGDAAGAALIATGQEESTASVKAAIMRALAPLKRKQAVAIYLDALTHEALAVRSAAHSALMTHSGRERDYDPEASPHARAAGADRWRTWWELEQDREALAGKDAKAAAAAIERMSKRGDDALFVVEDALGGESAALLRARLAEVASRIGGSRAAWLLVDLLADAEASVRRAAAQGLAKVAASSTRSALVASHAAEKDAATRRALADAVVAAGGGESLREQLEKQLADDKASDEDRLHAVRLLAEAKLEGAREALLAVVDGKQAAKLAGAKRAACRGLARFADAASREKLLALAQGEDESLAVHALEALAAHDPQADEALVALLDAKKPAAVRAAAYRQLAAADAELGAEAARAVIKDGKSSAALLEGACALLASAGSGDDVEALTKLAQGKGAAEVRAAAAAAALAQAGDGQIELATALAKNAPKGVALAICEAAGDQPASAWLQPLGALLGARSDEVRAAAVAKLRLATGERHGFDAEASADQRKQAIAAWRAELTLRAGVADAISKLGSSKDDESKAGAKALRKLGGAAVAGALRALAEDETTKTTQQRLLGLLSELTGAEQASQLLEAARAAAGERRYALLGIYSRAVAEDARGEVYRLFKASSDDRERALLLGALLRLSTQRRALLDEAGALLRSGRDEVALAMLEGLEPLSTHELRGLSPALLALAAPDLFEWVDVAFGQLGSASSETRKKALDAINATLPTEADTSYDAAAAPAETAAARVAWHERTLANLGALGPDDRDRLDDDLPALTTPAVRASALARYAKVADRRRLPRMLAALAAEDQGTRQGALDVLQAAAGKAAPKGFDPAKPGAAQAEAIDGWKAWYAEREAALSIGGQLDAALIDLEGGDAIASRRAHRVIERLLDPAGYPEPHASLREQVALPTLGAELDRLTSAKDADVNCLGALIELARGSGHDGWMPLFSKLAASDSPAAGYAARALRDAKGQKPETFAELLAKSKNADVRRYALMALNWVAEDRRKANLGETLAGALPALIAESKGATRLEAIAVAASWKVTQAAEAIASLLVEPEAKEDEPPVDPIDDDLKLAAAGALGELGVEVGVGELVDLLSDADEDIRVAAHGSLTRLTGKSYGFDPKAPADQRRLAASEWKSWWQLAEAGRLLGAALAEGKDAEALAKLIKDTPRGIAELERRLLRLDEASGERVPNLETTAAERGALLGAMAKLDDPAAAEDALAMLADPIRENRELAFEAFIANSGTWSGEQPSFDARSSDSREATRIELAWAQEQLARERRDEAGAAIDDLLAEAPLQPRRLLELAGDRSPAALRRAIAVLLGHLRPKVEDGKIDPSNLAMARDIFSGLVDLLGSSSPEIQQAAINALERLTGETRGFVPASPAKKDDAEKKDGDAEKKDGDAEKKDGDAEKKDGDAEKKDGDAEKKDGDAEKKDGDAEKKDGDAEKKDGDAEKKDGDAEKKDGDAEKKDAPKGDAERDGDDDDAEDTSAVARKAAIKAWRDWVSKLGADAPPQLADEDPAAKMADWQQIREAALANEQALIGYVVGDTVDPDVKRAKNAEQRQTAEELARWRRVQAVRLLGQLRTEKGIRALVRVLNNKEQKLRQAALDALQPIAGEDFGLKVEDNSIQRQDAIQRWRAWLDKDAPAALASARSRATKHRAALAEARRLLAIDDPKAIDALFGGEGYGEQEGAQGGMATPNQDSIPDEGTVWIRRAAYQTFRALAGELLGPELPTLQARQPSDDLRKANIERIKKAWAAELALRAARDRDAAELASIAKLIDVPALGKALASKGRTVVERRLLTALATSAGKPGAMLLIGSLRDKAAPVRLEAIGGLKALSGGKTFGYEVFGDMPESPDEAKAMMQRAAAAFKAWVNWANDAKVKARALSAGEAARHLAHIRRLVGMGGHAVINGWVAKPKSKLHALGLALSAMLADQDPRPLAAALSHAAPAARRAAAASLIAHLGDQRDEVLSAAGVEDTSALTALFLEADAKKREKATQALSAWAKKRGEAMDAEKKAAEEAAKKAAEEKAAAEKKAAEEKAAAEKKAAEEKAAAEKKKAAEEEKKDK